MFPGPICAALSDKKTSRDRACIPQHKTGTIVTLVAFLLSQGCTRHLENSVKHSYYWGCSVKVLLSCKIVLPDFSFLFRMQAKGVLRPQHKLFSTALSLGRNGRRSPVPAKTEMRKGERCLDQLMGRKWPCWVQQRSPESTSTLFFLTQCESTQ